LKLTNIDSRAQTQRLYQVLKKESSSIESKLDQEEEDQEEDDLKFISVYKCLEVL